MKAGEHIRGRLMNWKFATAKDLLEPDDPEDLRVLVEALAALLGNCGWIEGNLAIVVEAALTPYMHDP